MINISRAQNIFKWYFGSKSLCVAEIAVDQPSNGCPIGTYGYRDEECTKTCFCEDHCSWKACKLIVPPNTCVDNVKRKWNYDPQKKYWRTNLIGISKMRLPFFDDKFRV